MNEFHYILYGNWAVRRTFGPKKGEATQEWRKFNSEELHKLYSSPDIIWNMKNAWERRQRWTRFWWESSTERDHSEDQGVDGRMDTEWILRRLGGCVDWIQLVQDRGCGGLL
jgi:hypothetical protein